MTSTPATSKDLFAALSALIDLPRNARKIVITMEVGKAPHVQCEFPPAIVGELFGDVKRYTLHEASEPDA